MSLVPQHLLHTPVSLPKMTEYGSALAPGREAFVGVTPYFIRSEADIFPFPVSKRGCYLDGEKDLAFFAHYTFLNCLMECEANMTHQVSSTRLGKPGKVDLSASPFSIATAWPTTCLTTPRRCLCAPPSSSSAWTGRWTPSRSRSSADSSSSNIGSWVGAAACPPAPSSTTSSKSPPPR